MASPAQCLANTENAKRSTGPKTEAGKAKVAANGLSHGLFAAYEHLAPADSTRVGQFIAELHAELHAAMPERESVSEDIVREYAIAKWRCELFYLMEASCLTSAVAAERANPENAALIEEYGDGILLGHALRRDAAGPNAFAKLMRYEARVKKELQTARDDYLQLLEQLQWERENAKPIASPPAPSPRPETPAETPRNALCPCGSGQKFKRCCGVDSPAVLHAATSPPMTT